MRSLSAGQTFFFCAQADCDVVYFSAEQAFKRADLSVPVFQKESGPGTPVCYCFGFKRGDLQDRDAALAISQRISGWVKAGLCSCETRNPQGSCCLGNVAAEGQRLKNG
jgi:hypothetical protein